ncbi:MAG: PQQ-binding-like beta-propeller repeat protein [Planctomycetota bacterium]
MFILVFLLAGVCAAPLRGAERGAALRSDLGLDLPPFPSPGRIQQLLTDDGPPVDIGLSPPDTDVETVLGALEAAERLAAQGEPVAAAGKFQDLLDRHGAVVIPISQHTYIPVWRYGTVRLLSTGGRLLRAYRRSYDGPARAALDAARRDRSRTALLAVVRRYGATSAAVVALDALASVELEAGRPETAARACRRRLMLAATDEPPPAVALAKLAQALAAAGPRAELARLAAVARKHMPDAVVPHPGGDTALAGYLSALSRRVPPRRHGEGRVGRTAARTVRPGALLGQVPLRAPGPIPRLRKQDVPGPEVAVPEPAIDGDTLYVQSQGDLRQDELKAVDARTGRALWRIPISRGFLGRRQGSGRVRVFPPAWRGERERRPPQVPGTVKPAVRESSVLCTFEVGIRRRGKSDQTDELVTGRLDALSTRRERHGAVDWSVSTHERWRVESGAEDRAFRFVSSPVLAAGAVLVGMRYATSEGEGFVAAYDASTGRRLWRRQVAATSWAGDGVEPGTDRSPPVCKGAIVYYATGLGTVAALDVLDGSLIWLARYRRKPEVVCRLETVGEHEVGLRPPPNPPLVRGDLVLALPEDADRLIALDRRDGSIRWQRRRGEAGNDWLFLLAADERHVFVSGATVACLDVHTGRTVWRSVPLDAFPAGRGVVTPEHVMCPIEGGIALVELGAEGRLAEPVRWRRWRRAHHDQQTVPARSGNLTVLDDRLVVTRNESVSVFAAPDAAEKWQRRLARQPDDVPTLLKLGVLRESEGKWEASASAYRKALELERSAGSAARPTAELLSGVLRRLAEEAEAKRAWRRAARLYREVATLQPWDRSLAVLMRVKQAEVLQRQGDPEGAVRVLQEGLAACGGVSVRVSVERMVAAELELAGELAQILAVHGRAAYAEYEARAEATVAEAADDEEAAWAAVRSRYPNSLAAAELRVRRARRAIDAGRYAAAAGELLAIRRLCPGGSDAARRRARAELTKAISKRPDRGPLVQGALLSTRWRAAEDVGERIVRESVAEGSRPIRSTSVLVADRPAIRSYDTASGKLNWRTKVGWLGVSFTDATVTPAGLPRPAIEILEVMEGHPADRAGAKAGDLLLSFDGHRLTRTNDLAQLCTTTPPGRRVELGVLRPRAHRPGWHRLTLRVTLGDRPGRVDGRPVHLPPQRYARVVGVEGDTVLVDVDMCVLWLDRKTGRGVRRKVFAPLPDADSIRLSGGYRTLLFRGHRPLLAGGSIVAATPNGDLICFDLSGDDRWRVALGEWTVLRMAARDGRLFVIAGLRTERPELHEPELIVLDLFSGAELARHAFTTKAMIDDCHLAFGRDRIFVAVPGRLLCYESATLEQAWEVAAKDLRGQVFHEIHATGDGVVALVNRRSIAAIDAATGEVTWTAEPGGSVQRVIVAEQRVMAPHELRNEYSVVAYGLKRGRRLWKTTLADGIQLPSLDPVPFAAADDGRLFVGQNLTTRTGVSLEPTIVALRISDGKRLARVGLGKAGGYNRLYGGKISGGVITLITSTGLRGISAGERP